MTPVKARLTLYGAAQACRVPGGRGSQISRQTAREGDKVVSPTHRPPLPPRKYSGYSFLSEAESTLRPSAVGRIKPMKNSSDPATFWLVAQCLTQLRHCVPQNKSRKCWKFHSWNGSKSNVLPCSKKFSVLLWDQKRLIHVSPESMTSPYKAHWLLCVPMAVTSEQP
jgi:hypothetical protein